MYLTVLAGIFVGLIVGGYGNSLGVFGAVAAAATFALGFGMQDTIQAFLAGIFIFIDKPFEIGDWIEWDGNEGRVKDIQLRTTKVETFDNELLTVPNDQIANSIVMNNTANDNLRIRTTFGIGYDDDLEKAKEVVLEVLEDVEEVMGEPGPDVVLQDMGDSSVNLQAFYWIEDPAKAQLRSIKDEVLVRVKERFDEEEIDIPYPTRTIAGESLSVEG
ncbi:MAG: mechanosensitive ion channel family protein [Candidatus Nanohaloarchaeota archaeon QJJ-7]|nr:mechanosensitive ion channel family protein [Candidatus Nanohaloarchaeota archaeon QJJ-7]